MVKARIPAYEWHQKKGAAFQDYFGCEVPSHYGNYEEEYKQLRGGSAIRDVSFFGKIKVTGKDRQRFLQGMLTNDVKSLEAGKGAFALFLDVKGHIHADMKVYAFSDHLLLVLQHYLVQNLMAGLDRYIMSEDVRMQDVTPEYGMIQILGPDASLLLESRGMHTIPEVYYSHSMINIAGVETPLIRLPAGFALLVPNPGQESARVLEALNGSMLGGRAFETYRIESGIPLMHRDMDESNFPQECGLHAALNFEKGCYLGQETMARIDAQGHVNRHLVGILSSASVTSGDRIFKEGKEVGKITSTTHSLLLQQPLSLGFIRREFAKEGETVEVGDQNISASVRSLPLIAAGHKA
jgi:folate-binding protein YgfZ